MISGAPEIMANGDCQSSVREQQPQYYKAWRHIVISQIAWDWDGTAQGEINCVCPPDMDSHYLFQEECRRINPQGESVIAVLYS